MHEGRLRYLMCVIKCSTHQANLAARCAIEGAAAAAGSLQACGFDAPLGHCSPHAAATGAATRLWKHLMADYYEEFAVSAREYVSRCLTITCEPRPPNDEGSRRLQELYGKSVIPDDMLYLWNTGDLSQLAHALPLPHGADVSAEEHARLVHLFVSPRQGAARR